VAVVKDLFMSSMVFNASLSPNFNIDMGGIVGGLIGYAGANTLGIGLGAVNLATGIASLAQGRQSGGINSNIFQTINGTSQLQYSTLGTATQTTFVNTDSALPNNVQGNIVYTSSFISSGTYCLRTISDPLNLANSAGIAGQGIQGFSEWTPVYPGSFSITLNNALQTQLFDSASQSLINFGGGGGIPSTLAMFSPFRVRVISSNAVEMVAGSTMSMVASTMNIYRDASLLSPSSTINVNVNGILTATSTLQTRQLNVSTISGGTFPINIIPGIVTSTLAVSSLTIGTSVTGSVSVSTLVTLGSTQLATNGASTFGVTIGSNATPPIDGNSLSVKGNVSIGDGFDVTGGGNVFGIFTTGDDASLGFNPSSIVNIAESGGVFQVGDSGCNVSTSMFGTFTNLGAFSNLGSFSNGGVLNSAGGIRTSVLNSIGTTDSGTGWLPQISSIPGAYEYKMFLGQWQVLWGNTGGRVFAGGYQSFTFSNAFSTGTLAWMVVNGDGQTNTFANGNAQTSNTWRGAAANANGSGTTNALNYFAIGIAP